MLNRLLFVNAILFVSFIGVFFGIGYPEIQRNNFSRTSCDIIGKWNIPIYCCYKKCDRDRCINAPSNVTSCDSLKNKWNSIDPLTCGNQCPSLDDTSICGDGYECCVETPRQICPKSGSSCYTRYECTSWVSDLRCQITCQFCYNMIIEVKYNTPQGLKISNNTKFFDSDQDDDIINNYMNKFLLTTSVECFYDPNNI
ncbi:793_t:CDS:1 [Scutellospora calospora]|uniref:793_t:CDS:1 n=1 Tax=Scutellospora calospora TaxID=85575 RepID=A0ACA9JWU5_9GLOM|nr:793_t:CDS:1 [Scutellospora calospora]